MSKVQFIDFLSVSPHIETSFELAKRHLDGGDQVSFYFLGHNVPYREHMSYRPIVSKLLRYWMPERRAARMIRHPNLKFVGGARLPVRPLPFKLPETLEELQATEYAGADVGMGVASSLISLTANSQFDPSKHPKTVRKALAGSIAVYEYCIQLLTRERPDILYVFNGRWCYTRAALRAAQHLNVNVHLHERGANMNNFVVRGVTPHDRERIQQEVVELWEKQGQTTDAKAKATEWFEERRAGQPRDWHSFTGQQLKGALPDLPRGKRIVTYFSSSDDEIAAIGESYRWQGWHNQIDAVADLIKVIKEFPESQLVIRLHPHLLKKHPDDLARWVGLAKSEGSTIAIEPGSPVDTYALIEASDVVVTGGSTVGMESVYWGTPSILLGPSEYDRLGAVNLSRSKEALREFLAASELPVRPASALPYAYWRATFGEPFTHFRAYSIYGGYFMGVDLQELPLILALAGRVKFKVSSWARSRNLGHERQRLA